MTDLKVIRAETTSLKQRVDKSEEESTATAAELRSVRAALSDRSAELERLRLLLASAEEDRTLLKSESMTSMTTSRANASVLERALGELNRASQERDELCRQLQDMSSELNRVRGEQMARVDAVASQDQAIALLRHEFYVSEQHLRRQRMLCAFVKLQNTALKAKLRAAAAAAGPSDHLHSIPGTPTTPVSPALRPRTKSSTSLYIAGGTLHVSDSSSSSDDEALDSFSFSSSDADNNHHTADHSLNRIPHPSLATTL
ncbi:uncharacterized protein AMSG_02034, partial [Thecamonas trahens ATCC 50062]